MSRRGGERTIAEQPSDLQSHPMSPEEKQTRQLRYFEGLGCTGILICAVMLIAAPLIFMSACSKAECGRLGWRILVLHMSGSGAGLVTFELLRRYGSAALKKRGQ